MYRTSWRAKHSGRAFLARLPPRSGTAGVRPGQGRSSSTAGTRAHARRLICAPALVRLCERGLSRRHSRACPVDAEHSKKRTSVPCSTERYETLAFYARGAPRARGRGEHAQRQRPPSPSFPPSFPRLFPFPFGKPTSAGARRNASVQDNAARAVPTPRAMTRARRAALRSRPPSGQRDRVRCARGPS